MEITFGEVIHRFDHHPPQTADTVERHEQVREACRAAALTVVKLTGGPSREQSTAITKLEEAMFWANAAIAREITGAPE